jgi:tetratricopeptide (TPR) repeat protein
LERAIELDPRNIFVQQQIANSYILLQRFADAKSTFDRALAIEPNDVQTKVAAAWMDLEWKGDTKPLHQAIDSIRSTNAAAIPHIVDGWLICALAERDPVAANEALLAADQNTALNDQAVHFSRSFVEGIVARMAGNENKARSSLEAARAEQEQLVQVQPNYGPLVCVLGLIDAALGQKADALQTAKRVVELVPVEKDALNGALMLKYSAMIAAWVGEKDLACDQLARAIEHRSTISYGYLKLLPFWDSLRGDPRFEKIVASLAPE